MLTYAIRRLLYGVPVIALSSFLIFVFVSTTTDPLETVRLNPRASKSSVDLVVKEHHLDRPVIVRYGYWVRDVFTKSFGTTISRAARSCRTSGASSATRSSSCWRLRC
jgi:oligopeptide transport system permease protein